MQRTGPLQDRLMSLDLTCSPTDPADLELARRRLSEASARLHDAVAATLSIAARTDWQTPSARRFHAEVEGWSGVVRRLAAALDGADGDAAWLQLRSAVRMTGGC